MEHDGNVFVYVDYLRGIEEDFEKFRYKFKKESEMRTDIFSRFQTVLSMMRLLVRQYI